MTDQPGAIPMFVDESRVFINNNDCTWLVLHKTAGFTTIEELGNYFATTASMVSSHYGVGQDGRIAQFVPEKDGAAANCCLEPGHAPYLPTGINLNWKTISIEHIDPATDNSTPLTDAQKQASFQLIHDICQRHDIPMRPGDATGGIIGHMDIDPQSRARCPGNYPWDELFQFLQNGGNMSIDVSTPGVSDFFQATSDPQRWHCPKTGFDVAYGILGFYRAFGGTGLCGLTFLGLPVSGESAPQPNTAVQQFERGVVVYDPGHVLDNPPGAGDVYLMHRDTAAPAPQPAVNVDAAASACNAIIAAAQNVLHDLGK